jgi:hypothetical protein
MPAADVPAVTRRTRRALHLFLLVFAITGLFTLELFPFSGFRLFAEVRGPDREYWELRVVDGRGLEHPLHLSDLPLAYRSTTTLIDGFADRSPAQRDAVCAAWAQPLRDAGETVLEVRIYAAVDDVRPRGEPTTRALVYTCGRSG